LGLKAPQEGGAYHSTTVPQHHEIRSFFFHANHILSISTVSEPSRPTTGHLIDPASPRNSRLTEKSQLLFLSQITERASTELSHTRRLATGNYRPSEPRPTRISGTSSCLACRQGAFACRTTSSQPESQSIERRRKKGGHGRVDNLCCCARRSCLKTILLPLHVAAQ
jgi:hypothetical protein